MNILLTGAGAPGAAGIIKCLRNGNTNIRVFSADMNKFAYGRVLADKFYVVPGAGNDLFIDSIKDICQKESINIVIPLVTRELPVFAKHKEWFNNNHIHVCVQEENILKVINDKYLLMTALKDAGIQTPEFYPCNNISEFKNACRKLGYPEKTICFKPAVSNGSRGFRIISSNIDEASLLFEEKPNTTFISHDSALKILSNCAMPPLVVMEYLPGSEWSVDCLVNHGETLYVLPRLRNKMNGGISVDATVINDAAVIDLSKKICELFNIHGTIGIQFKQNVFGAPQILEINPRLQGTSVISAAAGVNIPYFGVLLCLKEKIPAIEPKWGTRMCRYWEEVYFDDNGQSFTYDIF
jgi:carbamoyl-phosphate synthase large subunit